MEKLAELCDHCGRTGLEPVGGWDPKSGPQPPCRVCNGTKYKLTTRGEELRKFVVAVLGDDEGCSSITVTLALEKLEVLGLLRYSLAMCPGFLQL